MDKEIRKLARKFAKEAKANSFMFVPEATIERIYNQLKTDEEEIKRLKGSRDNWKAKFKELKGGKKNDRTN